MLIVHLLAMHTLICVTFSLPPGVGGWLQRLLVAPPGLFCLSFRRVKAGARGVRDVAFSSIYRLDQTRVCCFQTFVRRISFSEYFES